MIATAIGEVGAGLDYVVEIAVPGGAELAQRTLNPRLGILGGISILGTTGIVIPYSCSAWIHSIYRGIDVARAIGLDHIAGATGSTSEAAVQRFHRLPETALIDMGDFVGGMLKYLRGHPVPRVSIAGGIAKMTKLGQGLLDLHSQRGAADLPALAALAVAGGAPGDLAVRIVAANTVAEAFALAAAGGIRLGDSVAQAAWRTAADALADPGTLLEILVFDREGNLQGHAPFATAHASRPLNRR
jgi:cobalt-precorrin-5B (C1)-methyltransferase